MRAVVVGPYPPTADRRADDVLAAVRTLRADGYRVDVVSPQPSAAAFHASPDTWLGATRIGRVTRGADLVVVVAGPVLGARVPAHAFRRAVARAPRVRWVEPVAAGRERVRGRRWSPTVGLTRARAGLPTLVRTLVARAQARSRVVRRR